MKGHGRCAINSQLQTEREEDKKKKNNASPNNNRYKELDMYSIETHSFCVTTLYWCFNLFSTYKGLIAILNQIIEITAAGLIAPNKTGRIDKSTEIIILKRTYLFWRYAYKIILVILW